MVSVHETVSSVPQWKDVLVVASLWQACCYKNVVDAAAHGCDLGKL